jgi:hypothetical protein
MAEWCTPVEYIYFPNTFIAFGRVAYPGVYLGLLKIQTYIHAAHSHKLFVLAYQLNLKPQRRKF